MKLTPQFFIISDLHFGHFNVIGYEDRPKNHNDLMIKNWNQTIGKLNKVLMLGDLSLTNKVATLNFTRNLNGEKYMLGGNHDGHSDSWYKDCGFTVVEPIYKVFKDKYDNRYPFLFTHEPVIDLPKSWYNIHGHIHRGVHRHPKLGKRHLNMSVEAIDYTPIPLYEILSKIY